MRSILVYYFWMAYLVALSNSLLCYDCRSDDVSCNVGECHGMSCLKMETSNMDNERKTVHKSCSDEMEQVQCKQSGFGSKLITRCSCDSDFCNGDEILIASGLQYSSSSKSYSLSTSIYLIFFICKLLIQQ